MLDKRLLVVTALLLPQGSGHQERYVPEAPRRYRKRTLLASSAENESTPPNTNANGAISRQRRTSLQSRRRRKKGRLSFDLHGNTLHIIPTNDPLELDAHFREQYDEASLTITPRSALRVGNISLSALGAVFTAFMGTLRLLAPL